MSEKPDASDTAPAQNNSNKSPSILNIKSMETNTLMRYESDVLEPLTFSQSECVFELQPKGFLHPGSSITVALDKNTTLTRAFPYLGNGIQSLVRRAVLRTTAGRVINDTDDWNHLQSVKSMFVNNSVNKEREQFTTGRAIDFEMYYDQGSDVQAEDGYGLSNGNELNLNTATGGGANRTGMSAQAVLLNTAEPEFQLKLHDLFGYCRAGNQLPLFLLPDERVQVVLYWANTNQEDRLAVNVADDGSLTEKLPITKDKCKFIANYTFYDGKIMDKFRDEYAGGLTFAYTDYRLAKQSVTGGEAGRLKTFTITNGGTSFTDGTHTGVSIVGGSGNGGVATVVIAGNAVTSITPTKAGRSYKVGDTILLSGGTPGIGAGTGTDITVATIGEAGTSINNVRNLGGNGMVVDSVVWEYADDEQVGDSLLGRYTGETPADTDGLEGETDVRPLTSNLFINSKFLYPQDISNPARHFHNLKEAESMLPFVSRCLYSGEGDEALVDDANHVYEGRSQYTALKGAFFHQGFRTSGLAQRINNQGIDLHSDAILDDDTYTLRAWLEIKRYVVINDGHLESYFV
tara:strand:+ start:1451 stop:3172 length:1722 start_codon:yes stop_codon:yes gene_type:complete